MEAWEIITSIITVVALLIAAIVVHVMNRWRRWGVIESDNIHRSTTIIPAGETPVLELIRYEYQQGQHHQDIPLIVLLAPNGRYFRILNQYAVGLCLADFPVAILKWNNKDSNQPVNFANIASKILNFSPKSQDGVFFLVYRSVTRDIIPTVACAAKNLENRWILLSPEVNDFRKWEIFLGNGKNIYIIYSLDSPKKRRMEIQDLIMKVRVPEQNIAPFPTGGPNLNGQETVILGKIISWIASKS